MLLPITLLTSILVTPVAAQTDISIQRQAFESPYQSIQLLDGKLQALDTAGNRFSLTLKHNKLVPTIAVTSSDPLTRPADILSDARVYSGQGEIATAWLGGPTDRYNHGVMGSGIEASQLNARTHQTIGTKQGRPVSLSLPENQVFEDRRVRYADLDNDQQDELIVIRTGLKSGAGIVSYGLNEGKLTEEAASDTIGLSNRWLNIIDIQDFTGDGRLEIAAVITPHIGGTLRLFRQQGTQLLPILEQWGYSNHEYGARELGMSAALDVNRDGVMDIAVPDENRRDLILLTAKGGQLQILQRIENPEPIQSNILIFDIDGDQQSELVYLLKDNTLIIVSL